MKVYMMPTPKESVKDSTNAIRQIVLKLQKYLPRHGVEIVDVPDSVDLIVGHAGEGARGVVDVAHCHGLYPTGTPGSESWHWAANYSVVSNLIGAKEITVPSQWVADIIRRDMRIDPHVVGWAIEPKQWEPKEPEGYVLWNKTRTDKVCDPTPMQQLAQIRPEQKFLSTFGMVTPNLRVTGRVEHSRMREMVRSASIYLATTKETFGIGTLEAMCSGVPVLGYRWGGTQDIVEHGVTGFLVEPGDIQGLSDGLDYCLRHRDVLGHNARQVALTYTWDSVAGKMSEIYEKAARPHVGPKISVVIPCYNYGRYVLEAMNSVYRQDMEDVELIVVNDGSTDDSLGVMVDGADNAPIPTKIISKLNGGVAEARNAGIRAASGEYITCLDADDVLGDPSFLRTLSQALDRDRSLGVAFSGLRMMHDDGTLGSVGAWPKGYDYDRQINKHNQVPTCCMFRKAAWERSGGYDKTFQPAEDARLWTIMGSIGYRAAQATSEPMFHYRLHGNSLSAPVRSGEKKEPDWLYGFPWITDGKRPFASDGRPKNYSWPVRNYDRPYVSIIIPVGPGHDLFVLDALKSLEFQTERHWEAIVVNDTGRELNVSPYVWAKVVNTHGSMGAGYARNVGVKHASSSLVTFLDADDVFMPDFVRRTVPVQKSAGKYVYTDWISQNKQGAMELHETPEFDLQDVFRKPSIHSISIVLPKKWAEDCPFDESMESWEDVDWFMKLASKGYCGQRIPEPLMVYRYSTGSRRELGETRVQEIKALLRDRYSRYMEGLVTIVCCGNPPKVKSNGAPSNGLGESSLMSGEALRVQYMGEGVPKAKAPLKGPATGTNYGRRAYGDVFVVWLKDFDAMRAKFQPISIVEESVEHTKAPPPPKRIEERVYA